MNEFQWDKYMIPTEFVGGPLDGPGEVHPLSNALYLTVEGSPEGYYSMNQYLPDGKFYWILKKSPSK